MKKIPLVRIFDLMQITSLLVLRIDMRVIRQSLG